MQDHIFVKLTTSYPEISKGEVIDIAIVRTNAEQEILARYTDKIKPKKEISKSNADVNGYNLIEWKEAVSFSDAYKSIHSIISNEYSDKYIVVVGNLIERSFLYNECKKADLKELFEGRAWIDVSQLAWPLAYCGNIENRKLETLYRYYGVIPDNIHTACGDVEGLQQVYWKMMKRFSMAQVVEQKGKDIVNDIVGGIVSKFGF